MNLIDYLTQNGVMEAGKLYEPPFRDFSVDRIEGLFADQESGRIVSILDQIRENAACSTVHVMMRG